MYAWRARRSAKPWPNLARSMRNTYERCRVSFRDWPISLPVQCEKAKASYSEVNKNSGILWSEATFKEYLIDPSADPSISQAIRIGWKKEIANARESEYFP